MKIRNKTSALGIYFVLSAVSAQGIDQNLTGVFPKKGGGVMQRRSIKDLSAHEKAWIMKDTVSKPEGYLSVAVSKEYIGQINNLKISSLGLNNSTGTNHETIMGLTFLGVKNEGANRKAYFFGKGSTADAMVTLWHVGADQGSIVMFDEFINQRINGSEATLSLAYNLDSQRCMWKLVMNDNNDFYEAVLPDTCFNNKPSMPVAKVLTEFSLFMRFASDIK